MLTMRSAQNLAHELPQMDVALHVPATRWATIQLFECLGDLYVCWNLARCGMAMDRMEPGELLLLVDRNHCHAVLQQQSRMYNRSTGAC
jgi:hypothetical protein